MKKTRAAGILLILSGLVTTAYASSIILQQNFPTVTVPAAPILTATCTTLVSNVFGPSSVGPAPPPGSGMASFGCIGSGGAFTASAGTVTYLFGTAPPSSYTTIALFPGGDASCLSWPGPAAGDPRILSPSGGSVTFAPSPTAPAIAIGSYHYCTYFTGTIGATLAGFSISWSQ